MRSLNLYFFFGKSLEFILEHSVLHAYNIVVDTVYLTYCWFLTCKILPNLQNLIDSVEHSLLLIMVKKLPFNLV